MKDINKAILVGRLGADPVIRYTKSGIPVAHFSVATTRRFVREESSSSGEPGSTPTAIEETQWHRVVAWARQAEVCGQYLKKGSTVYVEGWIKSHSYEDKTGQSRISFEIQSENICFLGGGKRKEAAGPFSEALQEEPSIPNLAAEPV